MAKVLLVDFTQADKDRLVAGKYSVDLQQTGWKTGLDLPLEFAADTEIVFYQIGEGTAPDREDLHARVHETLAERVREGVKVICFIGDGEAFRLANIVGPIDGLEVRESARPDAVVFNPRALFHVPYERFKPFIGRAFRLLPEPLDEGVWEKASSQNGSFEVLAKTAEGAPAAMVVPRGRGSITLLPWFGAKTIEVVEHILKDQRPAAPPVPSEAAPGWIEGDDYAFPELKALIAKRDDEKKRFEEALADYDRRIQALRTGGEEEFHRLLDGEGAAFKKAVINALAYLGWGRVVDVDQYWKNTIRDKEEDVWIIEPADLAVEAGLRKGELVIVLARSDRNWAADDECALLQKFKGRRMQEFDNTRMKAVLVGNYFSAAEAKGRPSPFSAAQIEEAQKDGNGLVTSYELFRAIKAEKEGRISKDAIRDRIRAQTGLITFEI